MPRGGFTAEKAEAFRKQELNDRYNEHRMELKRRGIDPDWIGSHEVKPVCCTGCGKQIPWIVLKGYYS